MKHPKTTSRRIAPKTSKSLRSVKTSGSVVGSALSQKHKSKGRMHGTIPTSSSPRRK